MSQFPTLFVQNPNLALTFSWEVGGVRVLTHVLTARQSRCVGCRRRDAGGARRSVRGKSRASHRAREGSAPSGAWAVAGYPQQNVLPVWPDNPNDASIAIGVIAVRRDRAQAERSSGRQQPRLGPRSGQSSGGYDLYVVTVTGPETDAEAAQQDGLEAADRGRPGRRAHGRGAAGGLQDAAVHQRQHPRQRVGGHRRDPAGDRPVGQEHRPGRRDAAAAQPPRLQRHLEPGRPRRRQRANGAGYDLNRDLVIISQPEARLIRDLIVADQAGLTLDLHGYVTPTLLWPSTPPHNPNNEYDLYIKHGLPNALDIEEGLRRPRLPRDAARADPVPRRRRRASGTTSRRSTCRRSRCSRARSRTRSRRR